MSKTMKRTLWVGGIVGVVHAVGVGTLLFVQGCGTTGGEETVGRPLPPVMPPVVEPAPVVKQTAKPVPPPPPPAPTLTHVVAQGEFLSSIAAAYGVTAHELAALNGIKDPNKLRVGQKLVIPAGGGTPQPVRKHTTPKPTVKSANASSAKPVAPGGAYVVKPGDCLSVIAVKHGVTMDALKAANNLSSDRLVVGQSLTIPEDGAAKPESVPVDPTKAQPAVPGEVTSPAAGLQDVPATGSTRVAHAPAALKPASSSVPVAPAVKVAAPSVPAVPSVAKPAAPGAAPVAKPAASAQGDSATIIHEVGPGEDLYSVSLKFAVPVDELKRINGLTGTALEEGMRLKVPLIDQ